MFTSSPQLFTGFFDKPPKKKKKKKKIRSETKHSENISWPVSVWLATYSSLC
jgi:hypothetical protein